MLKLTSWEFVCKAQVEIHILLVLTQVLVQYALLVGRAFIRKSGSVL